MKLKRALLHAAAAGVLLGLSLSPASASFDGYYAPSNWTVTHVNNDNGSVDTTTAPGLITLNGSDNGNGSGSRIEFTINAADTGVFSFDWGYSTVDQLGPSYDFAGYILGSSLMQLTDTNGAASQSGSSSINVSANQRIGFYVATADNDGGAAALAIRNFNAPTVQQGPGPAPAPEPATVALLGLGLMGMAATRRRRPA